MASITARRVLVVAGLGAGSGTGASAARVFSKAGYSVALVARGADTVNNLAQELNSAGGDAAPFPVEAYSPNDIRNVWMSIRAKYVAPTYSIDAAVFNIGQGVWKPFLEVTPEDIRTSLELNVEAAFAFSREAILTFKENKISEDKGKRGTLIFTGATASLRGNTTTSAFAAGKSGLRALSQSLAKEFGKENIHVAHAIIDGGILTERLSSYRPEIANNPDARLSPNSIAESYLYLVNQDRSSWTWELDLRPAHEKW
ncbi:Carbonyl reductase family member 4 [Termitomyces sp. J132]|nr:Carbonyl reductase family member 4 [Termitomyces sp. J132]